MRFSSCQYLLIDVADTQSYESSTSIFSFALFEAIKARPALQMADSAMAGILSSLIR